MKSQRIAIALSAINLVLLVLLLTGARTSTGMDRGILRGRALEIMDARGQVRSRINIESSGEVVFRLIGEKGTIRVKLGAGEDGSGLLLADETTEPGVHLIARRRATSERPNTTAITLQGADGQRRVIRP